MSELNTSALTFGSLFSGFGGIDLGFERAGMSCKWQVEVNPWARRVLEKHWPEVPRHADVRDVGRGNLAGVDVIAGGFPCQDISGAGKGAGIAGTRSGLWKEYHRIICELSPRYVFVENVALLLRRGLAVVLGDLARSGYDAEWARIPACAVGAPHRRDRLCIVAYPRIAERRADMADRSRDSFLILGGGHGSARSQDRVHGSPGGGRGALGGGWWTDDPGVPRVADGIPDWVERTHGIGNAVVPPLAHLVGEWILRYDRGRRPDLA